MESYKGGERSRSGGWKRGGKRNGGTGQRVERGQSYSTERAPYLGEVEKTIMGR